jgi:TolB-like protein
MKNPGRVIHPALFAASILIFAGLLWGQTASLNTAPKTPGKTNIAVINMKNASGVTSGEIEVISDRLRGELFNTGKVNVMERDQMQEILKEQGFQQSGACTNEACMVEIGQLLGVEQLVTGSLGKVGSMFLVNLRVIDVKTAKIMKVVSEDIKGDIEEVVGKLPGIASQLVGAVAVSPPPASLEKKEEPKKEEEKPAEQVKEEKPEVEQPREEKKEEVSDEKAERNKNRAGVHLGLNMFFGKMMEQIHRTYYDDFGVEVNQATYTTKDSDYDTARHTIFWAPEIKFMIKAGPFLTIDIGPGFAWGQQEFINVSSYYDPYNYDYIDTIRSWTDDVNLYGLNLGVNFVKRWYPVKLNVGLLFGFNFLTYNEVFSKDIHNAYYGSTYNAKDTSYFYFSFNVDYGARVGAEIMAGKHVGFNADFVFKYSYFETFPMEEDWYDASGSYMGTKDVVYKLTIPMFALGMGVNFYF